MKIGLRLSESSRSINVYFLLHSYDRTICTTNRLNMSLKFLSIVEIIGTLSIVVLLVIALNGNYWYDIKGADLTDQGFGPNLTLHGGLFRSCGPPLDPDSGKEEDCPRFEHVLGRVRHF